MVSTVHHQRSGIRLLLLAMLAGIGLLIIAALVTSAEVDMSASHGDAKHGAAAAAVSNCLMSPGRIISEWENKGTNRRARICELDNGRFGIQIIENVDGIWKEVTRFVKNKMSRLEQVENYLKNTGYTDPVP